MQTDRRTVTYSRVFNRPTGDAFHAFTSVRDARLQLEAEAAADLGPPVPDRVELGDVRLTLHRSDFAVTVELDVHVYEDAPDPSTLEES